MRFLQICWKFSKYTIFYQLTNQRNQGFGWRLKLAFEELGLTFIKIGQILSMRYDILSKSDCESLQALLDKINPIAFETVLGILEKEYKQSPELIFKMIYPVPLGSASVSQVHKAELFDGSVVAVKIKRPGVADKFENDINILKRLAFLAELISPILRHVQARQLVGFFESWLRQDLDFVAEIKNMKRIREQYSFGRTNFRSDLGKGVFPLPHENFCTANVIVMDYIEGILMSNKEAIIERED